MSEDAKVTKRLISVLEDGHDGFAKAASQLTGSDRPDIARRFEAYAQERHRFAAELKELAAAYGDEIDESGSMAGALHRGWMAVKDTFAGKSPDAVLGAAEQGEDHAVSAYREALGETLSPTLRAVVERQYADVQAAHDTVRSLREAVR